MRITTIDLDIAKNVFQVHGIDAAEKVVVRRQLRRGQVMNFFEALPPLPGRQLVALLACEQDSACRCPGEPASARGELRRRVFA